MCGGAAWALYDRPVSRGPGVYLGVGGSSRSGEPSAEGAAMATYVFSYRNPKGYAPGPETRARWFDWFEGMGDALVNIGQPVSSRSSLGNCDSETTELGGYSMVTAPDLQAALAIAKGCPHLDRDGGVEVGELADLQPDARVNEG
jgi:hypothetical protein